MGDLAADVLSILVIALWGLVFAIHMNWQYKKGSR